MARAPRKFLRRFKDGLKVLRSLNALKLFPILRTSRGYTRDKLRGDVRAGVNVALLAFPQGMAYALIAGLPVEYGIYGSAVATLVGFLFTGSHFITLGPTNATSVLLFTAFATLGFTQAESLVYLPLLVCMVGLFLIVGAYLRVASLIQYISRTVVTGYISAAAIYIIANQLKNALGFAFDADETPSNLFQVIGFTAIHLPDTHWPTLVLSVATAGVFLILQKYFRALPNVAITLVVISGGLAAVTSFWPGHGIEQLSGLSASNWRITLPPFDPGTARAMIGTAVALALLAVLEGTSIGKSMAARAGSRLDTNQEMYAIGMANIGCGLFNGMPASGSLTRSVLAVDSGAQTPWASFVAGVIVLIGAFLVGPLIAYIPEAALAVLVIFIGVSLINKHHLRVVTRSTRSDAVVFFATCLTGMLVALDAAIYLGTAVSIALFLRKVGRPELIEYTVTDKGELKELENGRRSIPEISIVHVEGDLFFGAAELFRDQMRRISDDPNLYVIVLKMRNAHHLDASSVLALEELVRYMNDHGRTLLISELRKDGLRVLKNSGLIDYLERKNIFPDNPQNPTLSTARALRRSQQILGDRGKEAKISVYVDEIQIANEQGTLDPNNPKSRKKVVDPGDA
ncbi:MAG: SulP family inorganic anion transporter [Opitutales bacterium]